ncbi:MAG: hypothetical protein A3F12_06330 [Gammaproteobacteria bacterium RIFCSPHIGHO2_12_FULL_38_14]|nr:MAG: hypothetical protein A3F12_06330 [Gammaproteobacteria bacterium RIFCSPHIGHO2_12_FULL_38_14]
MVILFFISTVYAFNAYAAEPPAATTAAPADQLTPPVETDDPLEGFNRGIFSFNDMVDHYILKPIATLYNKILPTPLNQGINNFFNNINTLPTIANDLLQLHLYQTLNDTWRLAINTTVGVGGLFDIASRMNLKHHINDFGLTLSAWGYKNSTYIVFPFFGPSTIRDGFGFAVDYYAFSIYPHIYPARSRYALYGLGVIDRRAQLLKFEPVFEEVAIDKYIFVRDAYVQHRAYLIEENQNLGFLTQYKDDLSPDEETDNGQNQS